MADEKSAKKMKITYLISKTDEIPLDIPDDANIQSLEINGKIIPLQGNEETIGLAQILTSLGIKGVKIGGNNIPISALLMLINLVPGIIDKLGLEIE